MRNSHLSTIEQLERTKELKEVDLIYYIYRIAFGNWDRYLSLQENFRTISPLTKTLEPKNPKLFFKYYAILQPYKRLNVNEKF